MALNATAQMSAPSTALTLKRVSLSSSGVGYFEYEARVTGNAVLSLPVALDKVDDVLKSLVVYDSKGSIGGVSLPGQDPVAQTLKQLPFDASALTKPTALLEALRGAALSVAGGKNHRAMTGRIVSVQPIAATEQQQAKHHVMLLTETGLQQFVLEDAQNLQFEEPALRQQLSHALAALSSNRAKDTRTVDIASQGSPNEARTVRVGYVTTVPIWKNAYRVTMPSLALSNAAKTDANTRAQVQGWAVVENMSGQDWSGVELTLTAGKPVAFSQQLYRSYFNTRPEIGVELPGNIVPVADEGAMRADAPKTPMMQPRPSSAPSAPAPRAMAKAMNNDSSSKNASIRSEQLAPQYTLAASNARAPQPKGEALKTAVPLDVPNTQDDSTQISYTFGLPVTVGSGRSLSIPIIQAALPMQRVVLYQPNVGGQHPLAALELENASVNGLPAGAATLYEQMANGSQFVGDAQLTVLPAKDKRYMAYALDQKIVIAHQNQQHQQLLRYYVQGSSLYGEYLNTAATTFTVKSSHTEPRDTVVEVPNYGAPYVLNPSRTGEHTLVGTTANQYRVNIVAKPGETRTVQVTQSHQAAQHSFNLSQISAAALRPYVESPTLDAAGKPVLERVYGLRLAAEKTTHDWNTASTQLQAARQEQARIQQSLSHVPANSAPYKTYLAELKTADSVEAQANTEQKKLLALRQTAEKALNDYVAGLK